MPATNEKERISARIPKHAYQELTHAAEISGATLNQFLVPAALEKAQLVIENNRTIKLTTRSANVFFDAIENPPKPTGKLKKAMKIYSVLSLCLIIRWNCSFPLPPSSGLINRF